MLIDWFTIVAQALNFLILVWLLRRFLYEPIRRAIDQREKLIDAQLAAATASKAEASKERADLANKNAAFEQERAALLKRATVEATTERQRLIDAAQRSADKLRSDQVERVRKDDDRHHRSVTDRVRQEVFSISRKALTDLASAKLEQQMVEVFICRLRSMNDRAKNALGAALKSSPDPARLLSAFELPAEQRLTLQKAINDMFFGDVRIRFETAPEPIGGIELSANGQKVVWSIDEYLNVLERGVDDLVRKREAVPT